jgi:hypothetical protein
MFLGVSLFHYLPKFKSISLISRLSREFAQKATKDTKTDQELVFVTISGTFLYCSNRFSTSVILVIFVTFCAKVSWCFPVSLLAQIQIDIAELAVFHERICTEGHKGHEDGSGIGFRHDLGYLSLLFESFFDVRNSL